MIARDMLKRSVVALLDAIADEHPLSHQDSKAARYVLTTPAGAKIELLFEKNPSVPANLWCLEKAANGLPAGTLRFTRSTKASLYAEKNAKGETLYGRHSGLEKMAQLGAADLVRFRIESLTDAGILLDHLLNISPAVMK